MKPNEITTFTNEYKPILLPGAEVGLGISDVIKTVRDTGIRVLETGTTLVKDVVSKRLKHRQWTYTNNNYNSECCRRNNITPRHL